MCSSGGGLSLVLVLLVVGGCPSGCCDGVGARDCVHMDVGGTGHLEREGGGRRGANEVHKIHPQSKSSRDSGK